MPGKRITNPSLVVTDYPEAISNEAKLLLDWDGLVWARPIPLKLVGNSWMQGSYDAVSWDNYILNDHNYLRVSTDGGVTWRIIDLTGGTLDHPPVTIGSPDGGLVISGDDTQVLTLSPATTTTPGSLSASDKVRINDIEWYDVANVGVGSGLYKDSTTVGDDVTFNFKTLVAGTGVTLTPSTDTITIDATGAGGGEVNTGSNQGTLGYGVFDGKVGADLQFRHIALDAAEIALQLSLDDVNNNIELSLDQTLIDHDVLTNFVPNEHIDHSTVSILTQEGITGGGDLTATRTLTLAFDGLSQQTSVNDTDVFAFYRPGDDLHYNIEYSDMKVWIKNHTDIYYVPLTTSINAGLGLSGGGTLDQDRTLYLDINGLPTTVYDSADYVAVYDISALTHAKVTLADIVGELAVSITAGNGMDFTTITSTGPVTLGTPSTVTEVTTNSVTATSHTHEFTLANLTYITDVDNSPVEGEFLVKTASGWATADPAIGASSPGLPLNSIQFNDNSTFGGNAGLLYDPTVDTIYFDDVNAATGANFIFGTATTTSASIQSYVSGVTNILKLENDHAVQHYIQLLGGRVIIGEPTLEGNSYIHIKDSNLSTYPNTLRIDNSSNDELLILQNSGDLYLPELSSAVATEMLYINPTTGLITRGAIPTTSGGIQTLVADSVSGLMVNGGSTSSASTIELDQNDNKLVEATPVLTDYIGFWDVSTSQESKVQLGNIPNLLLNLNGISQETLYLGNSLNIASGDNMTITYNSSTNTYTFNSAGADAEITCQEVIDCIEANPDTIVDIITDRTGNVYVEFDRADCEDTFTLLSTTFTSQTTNLTKIKITSIPTVGTLTYNGVDVIVNDELNVILGNLEYTLEYTSDSGTGSAYIDSLTFQLYYSSNADYLGTLNMNISNTACITDSICFGYLYNWYAIDDSRELTSSADWTVPTNTEWTEIAQYISDTYGPFVFVNTFYPSYFEDVALYMKSTSMWNDASNGNDTFGLNIKPSGLRSSSSGVFLSLGDITYLMTSTSSGTTITPSRFISSSNNDLSWNYNLSKRNGNSIRLVKDATGLPDGTTTTYTGNDGKVYNAVAINELYWTTENLEETQYRNGDYIPNVEDNTTWANLTTGALCLYDNDVNNACKTPLPTAKLVDVNYGYLYNWYAVDTATTGTSLANDGWRVPTRSDWGTLSTSVGGVSVGGGVLKEVGFTYWLSPNVGAVNSVGFNGRGSGMRANTGSYSVINEEHHAWASDLSGFYVRTSLDNDDEEFFAETYVVSPNWGYSVRLIKESTSLSDGETGFYEGNDGKIYKTICIGTQEWLANDLVETKYRNGEWIKGYDNGEYTTIPNMTWQFLSEGALCSYDENMSNAINP